MARIDRTSIDHAAYYGVRANAEAAKGETNDCAVVAVAAACQVPYDEAHRVLQELGRKDRRGTRWNLTHAAIERFGFKVERVHASHFIEQYPKAHQILKSVTTHHPDRFKKVWEDGNTYVMHVTRHVLTIRNGVNMDWSRGKAKRAMAIYRVTKK